MPKKTSMPQKIAKSGKVKLANKKKASSGSSLLATGRSETKKPAIDLVRYEAWCNNPSKVLGWMGKYDLVELLVSGDGLVKISNFLPEFVAAGMLATVEAITDKEWNMTAAGRDAKYNNISHKFWSTKSARGLDVISRMFSCLMPGKLNTAFSAAKYEQSHHIEAHDDRAYTDVALEDGSVLMCSREIACIYYLTKDWEESLGGTLIDCKTGTRYVPEYNSLIAFTIPRYHEVCAVSSPNRPRYSIFGWFLTEGKLYDLYKEHKSADTTTQAVEGSKGDAVKRVEGKKRDTAAVEGALRDGEMNKITCKPRKRARMPAM